MKIFKTKYSLKFIIGFFGGLLAFLLIILFADLDIEHPEVTYTLSVALLMAIWWITEIVPLAITSLLPVVLFPLLGIMNGKEVSATYFNHVIFLFIGGFLIALAMQKWNLHKRIALKILIFTGISPGRILLGFMFATAFLSMWISNTATTMMMIPILISIIQKLEEIIGKKNVSKYSIGLLLGVAYSASIGGMATLVGTPPNLSFTRIFQIMFPDAPEISFANWFIFALPVCILFFSIVWFYLYMLYKPKQKKWTNINVNTFKQQYKELGSASFEEKVIFIDFIILALLWLFRSDIVIGNFSIPGWSSLFSTPEYINDGTVAIACSIILFFIPSKTKKSNRLMDWKTASEIPWHIVLLFGGGFALASGFKESGLSLWCGDQLSFISALNPIFVIAIICFTMTFLTELTSNTATTEMLLPVLAGLASTTEINPLLFMLPATLSASMAFMLPVATPPNAIIFGTNRLRIIDMAKTGLILNLTGVIIITFATYFLGMHIFGIDVSVFPEWAVIK
ncbi:MAG: SLC13 family permease [Bacteroidales bacterium]|nr:SLC13 family permease [Bacteroidales bacterium]